MLEVQELIKYFGRRIAVDRVTFEINSSEIVGYLGPNGAGKSTTVKMIVGMLKPFATCWQWNQKSGRKFRRTSGALGHKRWRQNWKK